MKRDNKKNSLAHIGERNPQWKGNKVSYGALHDYIKWHKPKKVLCEECGIKTPYDISNIDGKYTRDLDSWRWLCRRCHMKSDGRLAKFIKQKGVKNQMSEMSWRQVQV